jgi:hypothetical protein
MLRNSFDGVEDRRIVVLRLVDPCRDRPHPHQLRRIRLEQISRIGLVTQPAIILVELKDSRHPVVDLADQFTFNASVSISDGAAAPPWCGMYLRPRTWSVPGRLPAATVGYLPALRSVSVLRPMPWSGDLTTRSRFSRSASKGRRASMPLPESPVWS